MAAINLSSATDLKIKDNEVIGDEQGSCSDKKFQI